MKSHPLDDPTYPPRSDSPPSDVAPPVVGTPAQPASAVRVRHRAGPAHRSRAPARHARPPRRWPAGQPRARPGRGLTELVESEARGLARAPRPRLFAARTPEARAAQATPAPRVTVELDAARATVTAASANSSAVTATAGRSRRAELRSVRQAIPRDGRTKGDARVHVVRPGESLWVIAERTLGGRPSAETVAREVERLWALNDDRIGTGDPDRLMVGTRLRLS